jgi:hypothetical protein
VTPNQVKARATTAKLSNPYHGTMICHNRNAAVVADYQIHLRDVAQIFMSPSASKKAFKEYIDMKSFYPTNLPVGGMHFCTIGGCLILDSIAKGLPCTKLRSGNHASRTHGSFGLTA